MSNEFQTDKFHNIQIVRKNQSSSKARHGVDWWTEFRAITSLQNITKDENRARYWKQIVSNTDISSMDVQINGSGDSGGIEEIHLYDKDGDEIEPKYVSFEFPLLSKSDFSKDLMEHDTNVTFYDTKNVTHKYNLDVEGKANNRSDYINYLSNGWDMQSSKVHQWKNYITNVTLYKVKSSEDTRNYWDEGSKFDVEFPSLKQYDHMQRSQVNSLSMFLDTMYYGVLPGGWEINEGSCSTVKVTSDSEKNPILEVEHSYYVESTDDYRINTSSVLNYIDKNVKDKDAKVLNLDTKKGSDAFYKFVNEINSMRES